MTLATQTQGFESLTPSGTSASPGNFGTPGFPPDNWSGTGTGQTVASDSTHAAHGSLGLKIQTGVTGALAYVSWGTSQTWAAQMWFRIYLYITANPASNQYVVSFLSGGTLAGRFGINTAGKAVGQDSTSVTKITSGVTVNLNAWFRLEGYIITSATTGALQCNLYNTMDSTTATDSQTSTSTLNTLATNPDTCRFGLTASIASFGPFWVDDIGLSSAGVVGAYATASDTSTGSGLDGGPGAGGVPLIGVDDAVGFP